MNTSIATDGHLRPVNVSMFKESILFLMTRWDLRQNSVVERAKVDDAQLHPALWSSCFPYSTLFFIAELFCILDALLSVEPT